MTLGKAKPGYLYAATIAIKNPAQWQGNSIKAEISDASGVLAKKRLHTQDLDF